MLVHKGKIILAIWKLPIFYSYFLFFHSLSTLLTRKRDPSPNRPVGKTVLLRPRYVWAFWFLARGSNRTLWSIEWFLDQGSPYYSWVWQWSASVGNVVSKVFYCGKGLHLNLLCGLKKSVYLSMWGCVMSPHNTWKLCPLFQRRIHNSVWGVHIQNRNQGAVLITTVFS